MFNFEVHADFQAVIDIYAKDLAPHTIRAELANALNQGTRAARKQTEKFATDEYNFGKDVMTKDGRIRTKFARADKDQMQAGVFVSSKPVSLRTFMVANKPVAVFIRNRVTMPEAFLINTANGTKAAGIFMRDKLRAKYAPAKGTYHGRIVQKGPNKGRLMQRQGIDKKYTLTTAQVADRGSEGAIEKANVVANFDERLAKILQKVKAIQAM